VVVDPVLWDEPGLSAALARVEFGPVFRRVRAEQGWSLSRLAGLLDLDQGTLSKIERGERSLNDVAAVIRCANLLAIPAGKLGFAHGVTVGSQHTTTGRGALRQHRSPNSPTMERPPRRR
jgi:transcriptional regulator with XRE-family HTH domain